MNEESILVVRPNPLRDLRLQWWRYVLVGLLLFGVLLYREFRDGPAPTGRSPLTVALIVSTGLMMPVLGFQFLISRCWYTSVYRDGLGVHEPLKAFRKIAWNNIKNAKAVSFGSDSYIQFKIDDLEEPLTMPLPESTVELKALIVKHAGLDNPISKALNESAT